MRGLMTLVVIVVGFACQSSGVTCLAAQHVGVRWQHDIESAKALAHQTGRLVLVHFWTPSCGPCQALERNVFNQDSVASALEARYVPVKLNADEFQATAQSFGITRVPTDVVITPQGYEVGKLISPPTPTAYISELTQVANRYASRSGAAFQDAVAGAPMPSQINSAYAQLPVGPPAHAASATKNISWPPQSAPSQPPTAVDRYAGQPAQSTANGQPSTSADPPANPAANHSGYAALPAASSPAAESTTPSTVRAAPTGQEPSIVDNRYVQPHSTAVPPSSPAGDVVVTSPPQTTVAAENRATPTLANNNHSTWRGNATADVQPVATPQLPPGSPPLAFDGYCPVTMKKQWVWKSGDPNWGAYHRGRTYLFANEAARNEFLQNPDAYSPVLSGADPVLAVDQNQSIDGRREHSLEYNGQFYLFSSEATLQRFATNPDRYAAGVRQAMQRSAGNVVR